MPSSFNVLADEVVADGRLVRTRDFSKEHSTGSDDNGSQSQTANDNGNVDEDPQSHSRNRSLFGTMGHPSRRGANHKRIELLETGENHFRIRARQETAGKDNMGVGGARIEKAFGKPSHHKHAPFEMHRLRPHERAKNFHGASPGANASEKAILNTYQLSAARNTAQRLLSKTSSDESVNTENKTSGQHGEDPRIDDRPKHPLAPLTDFASLEVCSSPSVGPLPNEPFSRNSSIRRSDFILQEPTKPEHFSQSADGVRLFDAQAQESISNTPSKNCLPHPPAVKPTADAPRKLDVLLKAIEEASAAEALACDSQKASGVDPCNSLIPKMSRSVAKHTLDVSSVSTSPIRVSTPDSPSSEFRRVNQRDDSPSGCEEKYGKVESLGAGSQLRTVASLAAPDLPANAIFEALAGINVQDSLDAEAEPSNAVKHEPESTEDLTNRLLSRALAEEVLEKSRGFGYHTTECDSGADIKHCKVKRLLLIMKGCSHNDAALGIRRRSMRIRGKEDVAPESTSLVGSSPAASAAIRRLEQSKVIALITKKVKDREKRVAEFREKFNPCKWYFTRFDDVEDDEQLLLWETRHFGRKALFACPLKSKWEAYIREHPNAQLYNGQDLSEKELELIEGYCETFEDGLWILQKETDDMEDMDEISEEETPPPEERPAKRARICETPEKLNTLSRLFTLNRNCGVDGGSDRCDEDDVEFAMYDEHCSLPTGRQGGDVLLIGKDENIESEAKNISEKDLATFISRIMGRVLRYHSSPPLLRDILCKADDVGGLDHLRHKLISGFYSFHAIQLLDLFESADTSGSLAALPEDHCMANFGKIRALISDHRLWMVQDVVLEWRNSCQALLEYFPQKSLCYSEIEEVYNQSCQLVEKFEADHQQVLREEEVLCMMRAFVCQAAGNRKSMEAFIGSKGESVSRMKDFSVEVDNYESDEEETEVREEQRILTFKRSFNDRDENGHSIFSKHLSAAVLAPLIESSRILLQQRQSENDVKIYFKAPPRSEVCHTCARDIPKASEDALLCNNKPYGFCEVAMCRICALHLLEYSSRQYRDSRDSGKWICTHCRSNCPLQSHCKQKRFGVKRRDPPRPYCVIKFPFADATWKSVSVSLAWRHPDGVFGPFSAPIPLNRLDDMVLTLRGAFGLGKYRGRLLLDNEWIACFELCICIGDKCPNCFVQKYHGQVTRRIRIETHMRSEDIRDDRTLEEKILQMKRMSIARGPATTVASYNDFVGKNVLLYKLQRGSARLLWEPSAQKEENSELKRRKKLRCSRTSEYDWRCQGLDERASFVPQIVGEVTDEPTYLSTLKRRLFANREELTPDEKRYMELRKSYSRWTMTGRSNIHGIGLFTLAPIEKGSFVVEYAGELVRNSVADLRESRYEIEGVGTYFFRLDDHQIVDATAQSSRARFLNHSCDPNLESTIVQVAGRETIVFVAKRYIEKCSELTFDYQLPLEEKKLKCLCNSWACKNYLN
eukprot:Plantae.Rhodophyta-Hildenbrandia_rubra.ctg7097.p1 GENE.Plantae.Rhodophyta-Hildenbrandia_rubra.ctg7097~~Plantae.Rhodophyta-Hildenbrandia_rubra.ctg7097.p1  ORF type:complete len:1473 (+),score=237.96 Plantae.Rhodophyta-Hildenbrandia_rubra.ctg7097:2678-7096(+)